MKKINKRNLWQSLLGCFLIGSLGCSTQVIVNQSGQPGAGYDPNFIVSVEPTDTLSVAAARKDAQDKQTVNVLGRIGGSAKPFVEGIAAFTMIDLTLPTCAGEEECSDGSCCSPEELRANMAMVKFVNPEGKPISTDARQLLNINDKAKVAVHGTVQRDDMGNFTLLADKLYVYQN